MPPELPVTGTVTGRCFRPTGSESSGERRSHDHGREHEAHALRFAAAGADVIALDVCPSAASTAYPGPTAADLAETARLVEREGRRMVSREVDVRDFAEAGAWLAFDEVRHVTGVALPVELVTLAR